MSNFHRDNAYLSLCGLNCALCVMHLGNFCPGCGRGAGNQPCKIAKCSIQHGVAYCYECKKYPCDHYQEFKKYDSFITHQNHDENFDRFHKLGKDEYIVEQIKKEEILHTLLADYNDGRKKSFYCLAVNLLPYSESSMILEKLKLDTNMNNNTLKEKAAYAEFLFREAAKRQHVTLKYQRKPKVKINGV